MSDTERKGRRFTLPESRLADLKEHAERKVLESNLSAEVVAEVALDKLTPAPWNARRYFDPDALRALGNDLKEQGQIHPLLVRPKGPGFEIVVGERRYRAALSVGLETLKAYIRDLDDATAQRTSLAENLEREDLNPYEETLGYLQLLTLELKSVPQFQAFRKDIENDEEATKRLLYSLFGKAQRGVNNVINGKKADPLVATIEGVFLVASNMTWPSFVQNRLPILDLPHEVLTALREGKLEYTKALALAKVRDDTVRSDILTKAVQENLSLSQIRAEVRDLQGEALTKKLSVAERASAVARALRKQRTIKDAQVRKRVEKLLFEIEKLLNEG